MATIYRCDGCDAESPDENGLHQANHWFEVTIKDCRCKTTKNLLLCRKCVTGSTKKEFGFLPRLARRFGISAFDGEDIGG